MSIKSSSDSITRDYFDSLLVETRYIDSVIPSTQFSLFGEIFSTPVMTAALSHLGNTAENGMTVYAQAAADCNAVHWVGMGDDSELESIVRTGAKTVKIIKPHADNNEVFRKIEHAVKCGCLATGMDIDHSFNSCGDYDSVFNLPMKAKSLDEIKEFVSASRTSDGKKIPFIVKGVLSPLDAEKCLKAGVSGIVVSHHHGMVDYSVPPLLALEGILDAVQGEVPVFIDCGIESGMDVYKCLAIGASAVSVGRHLMPLLKNGPDAVSKRIMEMNAELKGIMARTGIKDLSCMDKSVIHKRSF